MVGTLTVVLQIRFLGLSAMMCSSLSSLQSLFLHDKLYTLLVAQGSIS
jgi:hypothetical protein